MTDESVPSRGSPVTGNNIEEETAIADKIDEMKAENETDAEDEEPD